MGRRLVGWIFFQFFPVPALFLPRSFILFLPHFLVGVCLLPNYIPLIHCIIPFFPHSLIGSFIHLWFGLYGWLLHFACLIVKGTTRVEIHPFIHSSIHPFIHPLIHPFIHSILICMSISLSLVLSIPCLFVWAYSTSGLLWNQIVSSVISDRQTQETWLYI